MNRFFFKREERLKSEKQIGRLFAEGKTFSVPSFRIFYLPAETDLKYPAQILISVSKRVFKNAVTRNLLKRRMREAYRLTKKPLYDNLTVKNRKIVLALLYTGKKVENYQAIEEKIKKIIHQLINRI